MSNKIKLFIFSDTYTARILLKYLECKIEKYNFEIVLLSELGVSNDVGINIYTFEKVQQCVEACTQVLVIDNNIIPKTKIELVKSLANTYNKKCIIVDDFCNSQDKMIDTKEKQYDENIKDYPLILIISYGTQTQVSCLEIIINKLLSDLNFEVFQKPSNELNGILNVLSLCGLPIHTFNTCIAESNCGVVVRCVTYETTTNSDINSVFSYLKPDVIIVSISKNHYNYDLIENYFKFRYGYAIDIFVKSELIEMIDESGKRNLIFDFSILQDEEDSIISLHDPLLFQHLSEIILPKIRLPDGVTLL